MDQNASADYYIVASAKFVNESPWQRVTGVAILHYTNSNGKARGPLPPALDDQYDKTYSMNQARSIRSFRSIGGILGNMHSPCQAQNTSLERGGEAYLAGFKLLEGKFYILGSR